MRTPEERQEIQENVLVAATASQGPVAVKGPVGTAASQRRKERSQFRKVPLLLLPI